MKILSIKFKNINNLKGENEISFKDEPLHSAGIFAITGPTGSGKSTLLDVITLALFNKIPRFKSAITKSSIEGLGSVVTHHMDDAQASITYEIHQNTYTSSWSVSKTRTGNFKDYEMFIYDASGTPLDLKKSEVPNKNEQLIGLKYDQFVKSIILSQGQFSKFLKADKHERGQLLENLTGSSIYRKISMAAYEKYKAVKDEVALEKDRLENIATLSEEERGALFEQNKSNEAIKKELDVDLEMLNQIKQLKEEITKSSNLLSNKKVDQAKLEREITEFKDNLDLLDTHEKLSPFNVDLHTFKDSVELTQKLKVEILTHSDIIKSGDKDRKEILLEMGKLTQKSITVENFRDEMNAFEKEVNGLTLERSIVLKNGSETREKINAKAASHRIDLDPKAGPSITIPNLNESIKNYNRIIQRSGQDLDADTELLQNEHDVLQKELQQLYDLKHANEHLGASEKRIEKIRLELDDFKEEVERYKPLVEASQELIKTMKENIVLLQRQQQDALLIAKLSDHRNQLIEGEACPLCGSLDHPFADHLPDQNSEVNDSIQKAQDMLKDHEIAFSENNRILTSNMASQALKEDQLKQYIDELTLAIHAQKSKIKDYVGSMPTTEDKLEESITIAEKTLEHLIEAIKAQRVKMVLSELIGDFEELAKVLTTFTDIDKKLKEKYSGKDVSLDCNYFRDRFTSISDKINSSTLLLSEKLKDEEDKQKIITTITKKLEPEVQKIGFKTMDEAASFIISQGELDHLKNKKESFKKRKTELDTEIKTLSESLGENKSKDNQPELNANQIIESLFEKTQKKEALIKSIGENTAIIQKDDTERERIKAKENQLKNLQEKYDKWSLLNKLIGEKTGNKFANFAQGLTLQNLLVYANKRLQKLSDRYLLDKPIKDGALTVIDKYQGNIQRSVSTLSGGESFLISLALALSLSDMASKNVNLESLFIDEGFGTLDQESLDIAMNTLEKLQTESQKTVGVISHVEALKERIHVQIKLEKNAQGYGALKIEG